MDAAIDKTEVGAPTRGQRIGQLLLVLIAGAIVAAALYYALTILRATTFSTDRGFRVLDEAIGQFENLQDSMASLLKLVPAFPECDGQPTRRRNNCIKNSYQSRLDVPDLRLEDRIDEKSFTACSQSRREEFLLRLDEPRVGFAIFPCSVPLDEPGSKFLLRGSLASSLQSFNSQRFFDETLYALDSGSVLAELTPPLDADVASDARLQTAPAATLMVTDASHLLQRAASEVAKASQNAANKDQKTNALVPQQPVVFSETIAGQRYRVFVAAFRPAYPVYTMTDGAGAVERESFIYVLGLKREKLGAALAYALWPNGTFAITVGTLLAMLLWPLASLRLSSRQDPISRGEALAILTALILIPALLTIAVVWAWSYRTLQAWADDGAERYAQSVEQHLIADLEVSATLLDEYRRRVYLTDAPACTTPNATTGECLQGTYLPLRADQGGWFSVAASPDPKAEPDCCGVYYLWASRTDQPLGSWSPLRTALALDESGEKVGPRLSAFGAVPQRRSLNLADRSYFEALKAGGAWLIPSSAPWQRTPEFGMVAQRLFSRADAARTLQIAVPRCGPGEVFCGIVTGDSRVHALTAKMDPPVLRFAVIDRHSGMVLFHSDDSRSLAENFFTETERDADLHAAVQLNQATHFRGRYLGDPHRFYFKPVTGVPWGVVVFYPVKQLGDLPLQAGVAALTAFAGWTLVLITIVAVLLFAENRHVRRILAHIWPQWRYRQTYRWLGWSLAATALVTIIVGFAFMRTSHGYAALSAAVILPVASTWLWRRRREQIAIANEISVRGYERAYVRCVVGVLFLVSVLPAAWFALAFHDAQVHGLLREAMQRASIDVERRHALLAHDLARWVPNAQARMQRYPDPWLLARASVPAYRFEDGRWTLDVFRTMPWARINGPVELGAWSQQAWRAAAQSSEQLRRISLIAADDMRPVRRCAENVSFDCYRTQAADAAPIEIATPLVLSTSGGAASERVTFPLMLAALGVLVVSVVLATLVARRFFGVGVPFTGRFLPVLSSDHEALGGVLLYRIGQLAGSGAVADLSTALQRIAPERRIDLSRVTIDVPIALTQGDYLLTQLDLALLFKARRRFVLELLERMLSDVSIGVFVSSERPPMRWLHRADSHPEVPDAERADLEEEFRWDAVFASLQLIHVRRGTHVQDRRALTAPALREARRELEALQLRDPEGMTDKDRADFIAVQANSHYQRIWKRCTREERLALHQLANARFVNPANHEVLEALMRAGFVVLDPWPQIADAAFARFVRTAESRRDFHEWQRVASQSMWRRVKTPLLIVLLIVVGWLVWTAGDYVQAFSAILVAAIALLGQVGQVVNLVRGSVAQKGG